MTEPARVLVADCPWLFGDKLPGKGRGASKHYGCMTVEQLCAFELPPLADDCALFFWRVAAMQREALDVIAAWGFDKPQRELVWRKLTKTGKVHFGMGRVLRNCHETCLIATRGQPVVLDRSIRSVFDAPTPAGLKGRAIHSAKPDGFYELVRRLYAGPYAELFARKRRDGWEQYGLQLEAA